MTDVLIYGDTIRQPELRHEVPLTLGDPFLYLEKDGSSHIVITDFEWPRLHAAGVPTRQVPSVRVRHVGGLTTVKVPTHRDWLERNEEVFREKWGRVTPPLARYRRAAGTSTWHFCQNCPDWPLGDHEDVPPPIPPGGVECATCTSLRDEGDCAFY